MACGDLPNIGACRLSRPSQSEQGADFIEAETQLSRAPDEDEHAYFCWPIDAMTALRTWGRGEHFDPLVIADRFDVHAAEPRKLADRQIFGSRTCDRTHGKVLDPVVTTGCILRPM